jgi:hypothetical protein
MVCHSVFSQKKQLFVVSGSITYSSDYCGGANPGQEVLDEHAKPKPFRGKILYIIKGDHNPGGVKKIAIIHTDSIGRFMLRLPKGNYCIVQEPQLKPLKQLDLMMKNKLYKVTDADCLKNWWHTCFKQFNIAKSDITNMDIHFHVKCNQGIIAPCMEYIGPAVP